MLVFSISDFTRNNSKVLEAALTNEVIINNYDGKSYKLLPIKYSAASTKLDPQNLVAIPCR